MNLFLTKEELQELCGYRNRPEQIKWLAEHNYKFEIARDGRPRVLRAAIIQALGGTPEAQPQQRRVEPRWEAMK